MKTRSLLILAAAAALLPAGAGRAARIQLGSGAGVPGEAVMIAVSVHAEADLAGVNVRIEYDPAVFATPAVIRDGTLLHASHHVESHSPVAGRFNAVAFAPSGTPAFTARSGTVFHVSLQILPDAPGGIYSIAFTAAGPAFLASSGLSDMGGISLAHQQAPGQITILPSTPEDLNGDGKCDQDDLLILIRDWHTAGEGNSVPADINQDSQVDEKDLMLLRASWGNASPAHKPR